MRTPVAISVEKEDGWFVAVLFIRPGGREVYRTKGYAKREWAEKDARDWAKLPWSRYEVCTF